MAFRDSWHRALVYFGLAEDYHDDYDEPPHEEEIADRYRERPNVRRLSPSPSTTLSRSPTSSRTRSR
jgi:cell division inhibitor SepF